MLFKMLVIFFTTLSASHAAGLPSKEDSWTVLLQARKERRVSFTLPQYRLSSSFYYKATDVCLSGESLSVLEPIKQKFRMKCIRRHGDKCQREIKVFPRMNVSGKRFGCVQRKVEGDQKSPCQKWGMVSYQTKTSFEIQIKELEGTVEIPIFKKELKVPACKDVD